MEINKAKQLNAENAVIYRLVLFGLLLKMLMQSINTCFNMVFSYEYNFITFIRDWEGVSMAYLMIMCGIGTVIYFTKKVVIEAAVVHVQTIQLFFAVIYMLQYDMYSGLVQFWIYIILILLFVIILYVLRFPFISLMRFSGNDPSPPKFEFSSRSFLTITKALLLIMLIDEVIRGILILLFPTTDKASGNVVDHNLYESVLSAIITFGVVAAILYIYKKFGANKVSQGPNVMLSLSLLALLITNFPATLYIYLLFPLTVNFVIFFLCILLVAVFLLFFPPKALSEINTGHDTFRYFIIISTSVFIISFFARMFLRPYDYYPLTAYLTPIMVFLLLLFNKLISRFFTKIATRN